MNTLVNILGTSYSGTTMLDLMIGNDPNAFSCGEVYAWFRPWRKQHFSINCACRADPCPVWQKLKKVPEHLFHEAVHREMHVDFVIDSSKNLDWIIDTHNWLSHRVRIVNIVIWKDPMEIAYSYWKRGEDMLEGLINRYCKYHNRLFSLNIPFVTVQYQQLVENPQVKLLSICDKINMPYFQKKEAFWLKPHHHLFGSSGVRSQLEKGHSFIYKESWQQEFKDRSDDLQNRINGDATLQKVWNILERLEVDGVDP